MSVYTCNVAEPYGTQLLSGAKTVEGRIRKEKWAEMRVGDVLYVRCDDGSETKFLVRNLLYADTFDELYAQCGASLLPDLPATAWEVYGALPTVNRDLERKHGVVGMKVQRLE